MMGNKLMGLIGATDGRFFVEELNPIIEKHGYAWYGWTIPLRKETLLFLRNQGIFNLYGYSSSGCYQNPREASHMVEAVFAIDARMIRSHWDIGNEANRCPEPEKGIPDVFFLSGYEDSSNFPSRKLPRRTWFPVRKAKLIEPPLPLNVFTP